MSKFFAIIAFAIALPMSNPAHAYIKCDKKEDAKAKKKCEKNTAKRLEKQRKNTDPYVPSSLGSEFGYLDAENPLDTDDWYLGVKTTGIKQIDELSNTVAGMAATVRLTRYTAYINKTDKAAAQKLGGLLLPKLKGLKTEVEKVQKQLSELDPNTLVSNPMDAPKAIGAIAKMTATLAKTVTEIPAALGALGPVVKGAAAGAISNVAGQAADAVNTAKDAAGK